MSNKIYVLVLREEDGSVVRLTTAEHTPVGRESLEKQIRHYYPRPWIQTEVAE